VEPVRNAVGSGLEFLVLGSLPSGLVPKQSFRHLTWPSSIKVSTSVSRLLIQLF